MTDAQIFAPVPNAEEEGWIKRRIVNPAVKIGHKTGEVADQVVDRAGDLIDGTKKVIDAVNPLKLIQN